MNRSIDFDQVGEFLKSQGTIIFALVFGSASQNSSESLRPFSDIDIGIFTTRELSLLEIGQLTVKIEKMVKRDVDLVELNDLFKRRPNFAFQVIKNSQLLFTKDEDIFVDYKRRSYLYYLDVKPMLNMIKESMNRRIDAGNSGERNYA